MRTYNQPHAYYCGVDLHARSLYLHVLDHKGTTRLEQDIPASPTVVLDVQRPYREGLVVGCECMFAWYRLADPVKLFGTASVVTIRGRADEMRCRPKNHPGAAR